MNRPDYQEEIDRFDRLSEAAIDASSLIYCKKAGFLEVLAGRVNLFTLENILAETGFEVPGLVFFPAPPGQSTNDESLFRFALEKKLPLISEDKKLLSGAKKRGHLYYNSLMMLFYLLYKRNISFSDYHFFKEKLTGIAYYSKWVLAYEAGLYDYCSGKNLL